MRKLSKSTAPPSGCNRICRLFFVFLVCVLIIWVFGVSLQYIVCNEQYSKEYEQEQQAIYHQQQNSPVSPLQSISPSPTASPSFLGDNEETFTAEPNTQSERAKLTETNRLQLRESDYLYDTTHDIQGNNNETLVVTKDQCTIWGYKVDHPLRINPVQAAMGLGAFVILVYLLGLAVFLKRCSSHVKSKRDNKWPKDLSGKYNVDETEISDIFSDLESSHAESSVPIPSLSGTSKRD